MSKLGRNSSLNFSLSILAQLNHDMLLIDLLLGPHVKVAAHAKAAIGIFGPLGHLSVSLSQFLQFHGSFRIFSQVITVTIMLFIVIHY